MQFQILYRQNPERNPGSITTRPSKRIGVTMAMAKAHVPAVPNPHGINGPALLEVDAVNPPTISRARTSRKGRILLVRKE